jgi:hypothetical protein
MEESAYRDVFPLMCEVDILDAHDYREEVLENLKMPYADPFAV